MTNKQMTNHKQTILQKIAANTEVVGIIGLGYVGLPLAVSFAEAGVKTIGFDKNPEKVDKINHGTNYIEDIRDAVLKQVVDDVSLCATTDFTRLGECDALIIAVPTPLDRFKKPDMGYIKSACTDIGRHMKPGTFICLESTTYPTTTEEVMLPIIEENLNNNPHFKTTRHCDPPAGGEATPNNLAAPSKEASNNENKETPNNDKNLESNNNAATKSPPLGGGGWLAYSPERVDPGNPSFHTRNTPKVLGAMTPDGLEIGQALYQKAIDTIHPVSSPRVAEMVKILENTYRLVNISLINELALLSGKMDINIWEVIEAAKTKPFGFQAFYPGPGIGGHCIPLDPFYLEHIAKKYNFDLSMIHTAGHINMRMPHYMYIKIATALNRHKKAVNGSTVLFLGVAYKPNINDERESPALEIMDITAHKGGNVQYHDPHIPKVITPEGLSLSSADLSAEALAQADVVVLTTNHSAFDMDFIQEHAKMIVDMRNMIPEASDKVYKL
ncbi:MAG: nucleotide sugar dehydrogenase [Prolixibacteraceae bacterium]|nr:nucleotide sugar dehydrogenase [Prolixibacteraceae bacterium]